MGAYGQKMWELSEPDNFACNVNRMLARVGAQAVFVASNSGTQEDVQRVRAGAAAPVKMLRDDLMMVIHPNPKPMLQPFLTALVLDYAPRSRRLDDGDKP